MLQTELVKADLLGHFVATIIQSLKKQKKKEVCPGNSFSRSNSGL